MPTVLTIAGFDPSSGAGVTADLMVFAAHGLFGTACIAALTVQSTLGVRSAHPTPASVVGDTLECLQADLPPAGMKIGMVANADNINRICDYLETLRQTHDYPVAVVFDPVLRSTSGRELLDPAGILLLRERLLSLVDWITPNLDELAALAGLPVPRSEDVPAACRTLQAAIAQAAPNAVHPRRLRLGILATGGHLDPPDDFLLAPKGEELWLRGERVETRSTHGTGCALSSAFLSRLVLGDPPGQAAQAAKDYVAGALRTAEGRGAGSGPLNLLWPLLRPSV
jgi:hydroxymethylpyrimidine/phosphomethylpyrimidine kinase